MRNPMVNQEGTDLVLAYSSSDFATWSDVTASEFLCFYNPFSFKSYIVDEIWQFEFVNSHFYLN